MQKVTAFIGSPRKRAASMRFFRELGRQNPKVPSFLQLFVFRLSRTAIRLLLEEGYRDYSYYQEKGWLESDYYYHVNLGLIKESAGHLFDWLGRWMVRDRL